MVVWLGGGREKKWWGTSFFSLHPPKCSPQNKEKTARWGGERKAQFKLIKIPMCTIHIGFLYLFFFSSSNFFFWLFLYFSVFFFFGWVCVCVCAHLPLACAIFKKKLSVHTQFFFLIKMCYFFILFNENIIVNLYQLHFPSSHFFFLNQTNKFIISLFFHPLNQTQMGEN